jgi:hypothetical protein
VGWRCSKGDDVASSREDLHVDKKSNGQGCAILGEGPHNLVSGWAFHWFGDDGAAPRSTLSPGIMWTGSVARRQKKGCHPLYGVRMLALVWSRGQDTFRHACSLVQMLVANRVVVLQVQPETSP